MGGCRRIHVYLWGLKMEVGSTWVNLGCDMALVDGRSLHFGEFLTWVHMVICAFIGWIICE